VVPFSKKMMPSEVEGIGSGANKLRVYPAVEMLWPADASPPIDASDGECGPDLSSDHDQRQHAVTSSNSVPKNVLSGDDHLRSVSGFFPQIANCGIFVSFLH
jgi:hypothetical protein